MMNEFVAEIRDVSYRLVDNARSGVWDSVEIDARIRDALIKQVPLTGDGETLFALFQELQSQNAELRELISMEQRRIAEQKTKYRRSHVAISSYLDVSSGRRR